MPSAPEPGPFAEALQVEFARVRPFVAALGLPFEVRPMQDGSPGLHLTRPPLRLLQLFPEVDPWSGSVGWRAWGVLDVADAGRARLLEVVNGHNLVRPDAVWVVVPGGLGCRRTVAFRRPGHVRSLVDALVADLEEAAASAR